MRKKADHIADVVNRNIKVLLEVRRQLQKQTDTGTKVADGIMRFCGSLPFVIVHAAWFGCWIAWNINWLGFVPFDPFPFGLLTMIISLEAIFLSTFVLISQKRMGELADARADLDLQINLLAEYEITKVLSIVDGIADHLGLEAGKDPELEELKVEISPDLVLREMEKLKNAK